ncbi:ccch zinc finger protein [Moniliophthora roreri]|nr:ccch zinc finger protein [Moniliophthora roreri]
MSARNWRVRSTYPFKLGSASQSDPFCCFSQPGG